MSLGIDYDEDRDVVTIDGILYSGEFFRQFGSAKMGTVLRIVQRMDGVVSVAVQEAGEGAA